MSDVFHNSARSGIPVAGSGLRHVRFLGLVVYCGMVLVSPVLICGFPSPTHDGELHWLWLDHFTRQLRCGDLYPRWLMDMNQGRGSPVFQFYPPVPSYLTTLLTWPLPESVDGWRRLGVGAAVALLISGIGAHRWLSAILGPRNAIAGAVFYMALPYHLAVDLYCRGAFAEFWAFAWLPWILRWARALARPWAGPAMAAGFALLLMTHPPTALIFSPVPLLVAAAVAQRGARLMAVIRALGSLTLGASLAGVYLIPALTTQDHVQMEWMHQGDMQVFRSFFFQSSGSISPFARGLLPVLLFMGILGAFAAVAALKSSSHRPRAGEAWFWLMILGASWFMMIPASEWIYRSIPLLQRIQFPWRFGVLLVLADAALIALAVQRLRAAGRPRALWLGGGVAGLLVLWSSIPSIRLSGFGTRPAKALSERLSTARDAPEYAPRWAAAPASATSDSSFVRSATGPADAWLIGRRPRELVLWVEAGAPVGLELNQFFYPGWEARTARGEVLELSPSPKEGLMRLAVPAGAGVVRLVLRRSEAELWGGWISAAALLTGAAWWCVARRGVAVGGKARQAASQGGRASPPSKPVRTRNRGRWDGLRGRDGLGPW